MIVDMHCHVLPGLDDGPKTMNETIALLAEMGSQGVEAMIVTPHFHPGRYKVFASQVIDTLSHVQQEISSRGMPIRLIPGQECYYYTELVHELHAGNVLTMAGTHYVMVEFDPEVIYSNIRIAVRDLISNGYIPIIAHFERYRCLNDNIDRLQQLRYEGASLQLNFGRLLQKDGILRRNPWRRLLKEGYVDYLGSDTHGMEFRPPHIAEAVKWIQKEASAEIAKQILNDNIQLLLNEATQ